MALNINDLITKSVTSAISGVNLTGDTKNTVLNGLSNSIFGSLTQTAAKPGGIEQLKGLLTGSAPAVSSPITALATKLFTGNILSKLGLGNATNSILTGLIPGIMGKLSGVLKDVDGDGDVDFQDILITLKGGAPAAQPAANNSAAGAILGTAAKNVLGSILKKK